MDNKELDKDVQAAVNKLVADEWFAGQAYRQFVLCVSAEDRSKIAEQMLEISSDEINDHFKSLVDFALSYGFSVPSTYNEMKKLAEKEDVKLFEDCKKGKDALFYIEKGIESEKRAIEAYQKYVDDYSFGQAFQEIKLIVSNNYYDEIDHLKKLEFMKNALEAAQSFS